CYLAYHLYKSRQKSETGGQRTEGRTVKPNGHLAGFRSSTQPTYYEPRSLSENSRRRHSGGL
ncbi:MAG: hypothetical protein WCA08_24875, partial [Desulfoferrobacter sp.]